MKRAIRLFLLAAFLLSSAGDALAGFSMADSEMHYKPEEVVAFAKKVEKTLAAKGARVAILARVGRPKDALPEGISYTHTAIVVYSRIKKPDGSSIPGYAIYNLYQRSKEPNVSDLIMDFPVDFFAGVYSLEAGIVIPSPELQKRILGVIGSETYSNLHTSKYSVIANPFTLEYQNCTEHTLDVITAAIYQTDDIQAIKASEKAYFEAQPVNVNPLKLALGSMFISDVTTSDHPDSPETATFTTIARFLQKYDVDSEVLTLKAD